MIRRGLTSGKRGPAFRVTMADWNSLMGQRIRVRRWLRDSWVYRYRELLYTVFAIALGFLWSLWYLGLVQAFGDWVRWNVWVLGVERTADLIWRAWPW